MQQDIEKDLLSRCDPKRAKTFATCLKKLLSEYEKAAKEENREQLIPSAEAMVISLAHVIETDFPKTFTQKAEEAKKETKPKAEAKEETKEEVKEETAKRS